MVEVEIQCEVYAFDRWDAFWWRGVEWRFLSFVGSFSSDGKWTRSNWYVGKEVGEIWGYRASGLIQTQAEADAYNEANDLSYISGQDWTPGDLKYTDVNGSIAWKGLSLSMVLQGVAKRDWSPGSNTVYFWGSGAYAYVPQ